MDYWDQPAVGVNVLRTLGLEDHPLAHKRIGELNDDTEWSECQRMHMEQYLVI